MKLGYFNEEKAQDQAIAYLSKSIYILSKLIDVDPNKIDTSIENPYEKDHMFFNAYECLRAEIISLEKIKNQQEGN